MRRDDTGFQQIASGIAASEAGISNPSITSNEPYHRNLVFCWQQENTEVNWSAPNDSYIHCAKYNLYNTTYTCLWQSPHASEGCKDESPCITMFSTHSYASVAWQHYTGKQWIFLLRKCKKCQTLENF
ncbi:MAG: hypothetical protein WAN36_03435 [Calditrichia bacterium]